MASTTTEPHGVPKTYGGVIYGAALKYDGILPDEYREIT